ncbi:hypothetical protein [Streptomyces sp. NPDC048489]|uniref:hypothetical protein n=1 Tax=Streptomyces sp. NPDC048489 TaxID=3154504 RepID=UPI00341AC5F9
MKQRSRKSPSPTKPLVRASPRIGALNFPALVGELRQLHEEAEDPNTHRMPDDHELFGALLYLETHEDVLKSQHARQKAALARVALWQYLRERADIHQARAIESARSAHVEWAQLAPALAVNAPNAAYNKSLRLRAAALSLAPEAEAAIRRTPEAFLEAERKAAARADAVRRAEQEAARRHRLLAPVAARLLRHRSSLDDGDDVTYWLDEIEAVLPSCETPTQQVSLATYVRAVVREVRIAERGTEYRTGMSDDARTACAAAAELLM